jgi:DNA repair protein SbcD/Mre11
MSRRLRFIHSSDWHLERPPGGLAEVPERLKPAFADAPYLAAEKVVSTALSEQADFVVLAGDLIDVELAGPRGVAFLVGQFERLADRQIPVYWAGGRVDRPERWPTAVALPDKVHRFPARRPEDFIVQIGDQPVARVTGLSRPRGGKIRAGDFWPDADGLPSIAVVHGRADRTALAARKLTYWALGGKHRRSVLLDGPQTVVYAGSPQARSPGDTGAYGCTVVEIDEEGRVHIRQVATDLIRWCPRRVTIDEAATADSLEALLADQLHDLRRELPDLQLLVSWTIGGKGPLIAALRRGTLSPELLSRLRRRAESENHPAWSVAIEVEPEAAVPPAWSEQDSLLGDYLRSLASFDGQSEPEPADLIEPIRQLAQRYGASADLDRLLRLNDEERRRVLQKAAALGADLLLGEETRP